MIFRQFLNEPISAASYLIGCVATGEAAVVDPGLPPEEYAMLAADKGLRITVILETHFHADYISTGRALARLTGATIYAPSRDDVEGPQTGCGVAYDHVRVNDGDRIRVGNIVITAIHTPGHTPEHMSYAVTDTPRAEQPWFVLTGDCLFVGDVGRADLVDLPLSGPQVLYQSLQRLLALPEDVEIYPAHYGGSACGGKAMSGKVASTISFEKKFNWALRFADAESFAAETSSVARTVVDSVLLHRNTNRGVLPLPEGYFAPPRRGDERVVAAGLTPLSVHEAAAAIDRGAVLIDLRTQVQFAGGHPEGAINVTFNKDNLRKRVAAVTDAHEPLITIADTPFVARAGAELLAAAGRNPVLGYVDAGVAAWALAGLPTATLPLRTLDELHAHAQAGDALILDVREPFEWEKGVIEGSRLIALGEIRAHLDELSRDQQILIICESGTRASAVTSMLRRMGYNRVEHVAPDGMSDYARRFPTVKPVVSEVA
ncbi:MAG: MBL fold hydrolase [Chloroflexi bacterium OHK40]